MIKPRKKTSHKGQNGTVLVIGGSEDYIGASTFVGMSALACMRSGADLVTVVAPEKTAWAINCISPDLITRKLQGKNFTMKHASTVLKLAQNVDVVEIGNGITSTPGAKQFMKTVIRRLTGKKPLVIDAGALHVVKIQELKNSVLLPHAKELKALLKNSKLTEKTAQKNLGTNVLVKKGHPNTIILSKTKKAINTTGNAGMTHGGTGDVLAGIVSALIAQGNDLFTSAKTACCINGKAADYLYRKKGFGYLASDLVETIPLFLKRLQRLQ